MRLTAAKVIYQLRYLALAGAVLLYAVNASQAVGVSASNNPSAPTNYMGLPAYGGLNPGAIDYGSLGLAAPASGSSSATTPFAYPAGAPNPSFPVEMYGNAVSKITNLGAGSFQVEVTLTNFTIDEGSPSPANEYVYLNTWETFTGLGLPSSLAWSTTGNVSVTGNWTALPVESVAIEPIAIVYDPSATAWTNVSTFFGANGTGPGSGPLSGSAPVSALTPYVSGGQLTVGMQTILLLQDPAGAGGAAMHLPTSLHLSLTLTPVPVPEPATLSLAVLGLAGLICRRCWKRRR